VHIGSVPMDIEEHEQVGSAVALILAVVALSDVIRHRLRNAPNDIAPGLEVVLGEASAHCLTRACSVSLTSSPARAGPLDMVVLAQIGAPSAIAQNEFCCRLRPPCAKAAGTVARLRRMHCNKDSNVPVP
jgi:hypothetical protein